METVTAKAYAIEDEREQGAQLMALVCNDTPTPRLAIIERLVKIKSPNLINIKTWFIEYLPNTDEKKLILIVNRPMGDPLVDRGGKSVPKLTVAELKEVFLLPVAEALKALHDHRIPHRSIRPDNLYYTSHKHTKVCLGEGFTTPSAFLQPTAFETIPCGMCPPHGRGSGSISDDIYALGVTAMCFLYGDMMGAEGDVEHITYEKLAAGSYTYFMRGRITYEQMTPFLTGTLADNEKERWTIESVIDWLEGKTVRLLIGSSDLRGGRPKVFNERENFACGELAYSMALDWKSALEFLKTDQLVNWVRFSVVDPQKTEELEELLESSNALKGANVFRKNALLSRTLLTLSNKICIQWEGLAVMPSGIGTYLAHTLTAGENTKKIEEVMHARMAVHWDETQRKGGNNPARLLYNFDSLPRILDRQRIGYGVEAVMYMLNPSMPCMSPLVRKEFVTTIDGLLQGLEKRVSQGAPENLNLLDQHIMAFVVARTRILRDADLRSLLVKDPTRYALNSLKILAKLQTKSATDQVPALAAFLLRQTKNLIKRYRHLPTKKKVEEACQAAVQGGDIAHLRQLIDNPTLLHNDQAQFQQACHYFDAITKEISYLKENILHSRSFARSNASKAYAIAVSTGLSTVSLLSYFIYYFYYGGL